jgi:predicted phosphate transport protein (TIGR00153 family)
MSAIRWLGVKKERELFENCLEHSQKTRESAEQLRKAVKDLVQGKYDDLDDIAEEIISRSKEGDRIAHTMRDKIASSSMETDSRHDLLDLLFQLEAYGNGIEASAHRMEMAYGLVVPEEVGDLLVDLVDAVIRTAESLDGALEKVAYDWRSALDQTEVVRECETEVDDIRRETMGKLASLADEIGVSAFWRLKEIVMNLEDAADAAQETANTIDLIIASRYG